MLYCITPDMTEICQRDTYVNDLFGFELSSATTESMAQCFVGSTYPLDFYTEKEKIGSETGFESVEMDQQSA